MFFVFFVDRLLFLVLFVGIYIVILGVVYYVFIFCFWVRVSEGFYISGRRRRVGGFGVYLFELVLMVKDFKIVLRNIFVFMGLLVFIVIFIINVVGIFLNLDIGVFGGRFVIIIFVVVFGWVFVVFVEIFIKIEVKFFEFFFFFCLSGVGFLEVSF